MKSAPLRLLLPLRCRMVFLGKSLTISDLNTEK